MNQKEFLNQFSLMTCLISVEILEDGNYGAIKIVEGNDAYANSIDLARGNRKVEGMNHSGFVPNVDYTHYLPHDTNFEINCYRCAVLKEPIHELIDAERYDFSINAFFTPLESDDEKTGYCTYAQILSTKDRKVLSSKISLETAQFVLDTCIKLRGTDDFKTIMNEIVEDMRVGCGADLSCVMLLDQNKRSCSVLAESKEPDSELLDVAEYVNDDFYALAESWLDTLEGAYCLVIQNEHDMNYLKRKNPAWYVSLVTADVKTLILFPLRSRGHFLGYIWAVNFNPNDVQRIKDSLELTTYFIASEIASYQFVERLRAISEMDELTGVLNRNEMNSRIQKMSNEKNKQKLLNTGIVFADMNGLKYVNDHDGHEAGDMLLKNAAMILQSTFAGDAIFRAGGDEFMIIEENTTTEEIQKKVDEIKMKSEMFDNVRFAAGCSLIDETKNVREALKEADSLMYADKRKYYAEHPDWARK